MLMGSMLGLIFTYGASAGLIAAMWAKPIALDTRLQDAACNKFDNRDIGSRICAAMPQVRGG